MFLIAFIMLGSLVGALASLSSWPDPAENKHAIPMAYEPLVHYSTSEPIAPSPSLSLSGLKELFAKKIKEPLREIPSEHIFLCLRDVKKPPLQWASPEGPLYCDENDMEFLGAAQWTIYSAPILQRVLQQLAAADQTKSELPVPAAQEVLLLCPANGCNGPELAQGQHVSTWLGAIQFRTVSMTPLMEQQIPYQQFPTTKADRDRIVTSQVLLVGEALYDRLRAAAKPYHGSELAPEFKQLILHQPTLLQFDWQKLTPAELQQISLLASSSLSGSLSKPAGELRDTLTPLLMKQRVDWWWLGASILLLALFAWLKGSLLRLRIGGQRRIMASMLVLFFLPTILSVVLYSGIIAVGIGFWRESFSASWDNLMIGAGLFVVVEVMIFFIFLPWWRRRWQGISP